MATIKSFQESSLALEFEYLSCDICGSKDIVATREGYVCRACGIVLEVQKLQYDRPYNEDLIQYKQGVGITQIGTKRERAISPHSRRLKRLNRHNSIEDNEKIVKNRAHAEITKILASLNLEDYYDIKTMIFERFLTIHEKLQSGTKYRNIEKLISIITYFCLKIRNISVNLYELIEVSEITKKEFNDFILQVRRYLPEYMGRDRRVYIDHRILEVSEHFGLGMEFYYLAKKIRAKLWHGIKNTTDDAVCGLVSSMALLCSKNYISNSEKVSVNSICRYLGIRASTVQAQVKRKVFDRFKVKGFVSLIKSSDLLRAIIEKLGLIEHEEEKEVITSERVDIVLGNVARIFNIHNTSDYYFFAIRGNNRNPTIITLKINDFPLEDNPSQKREEINHPNLLEFELYKYFPDKGPPMALI